VSRPLEDCEGCPAFAGVRNLGLDDPSAGCSDLRCNFGNSPSAAHADTPPESAVPTDATTLIERDGRTWHEGATP